MDSLSVAVWWFVCEGTSNRGVDMTWRAQLIPKLHLAGSFHFKQLVLICLVVNVLRIIGGAEKGMRHFKCPNLFAIMHAKLLTLI